jgi:hypothetical protein
MQTSARVWSVPATCTFMRPSGSQVARGGRSPASPQARIASYGQSRSCHHAVSGRPGALRAQGPADEENTTVGSEW